MLKSSILKTVMWELFAQENRNIISSHVDKMQSSQNNYVIIFKKTLEQFDEMLNRPHKDNAACSAIDIPTS